jgi:hypothetical protein
VVGLARARGVRDYASVVLDERYARMLREICDSSNSVAEVAADIGIAKVALLTAIARLPMRRITADKLGVFFGVTLE